MDILYVLEPSQLVSHAIVIILQLLLFSLQHRDINPQRPHSVPPTIHQLNPPIQLLRFRLTHLLNCTKLFIHIFLILLVPIETDLANNSLVLDNFLVDSEHLEA
jgi:hypothetical protein